jgi:hypothetical protein
MINVSETQRINDLAKEMKSHNINVDDLKNNQGLKIYESPEYSSEMTEAEKATRKLTFRIQENEKQIQELKKAIEMLNSDFNELKKIRKQEAMQKELQSPVQKKVVVRQVVEEVEDNEDPYAEIYKTVDNTPNLKKPIDRNRVAPADVQIDKIFYCGK